MEFSAEMVASFLEGEVIGNNDAKVWSIAKIEEAQNGDLAFLSNPKYENYIYTTGATIVLVNKDFTPKEEIKATLIKVEDAYKAFAGLLDLYIANKPQKKGVSPQAAVDSSAKIGENVYIGAFAVVEAGAVIGDNTKIYPHVYVGDNVKIGEDAIIYSGVNIYEECIIGDRVILHSGVVVGADGFGFAPVDGVFKKIPQIGNVIIEEDVEIGANSCIDRATMGSTVVKKGVKLDNLVQVAHNVTIGENTVLASQVGIAGSTKIGRNCMFGGQVGIAGHITVADFTQITSQSGIGSTVKKTGQILMGSPAFDASIARRSIVGYKNLPQIMTDIAQIKTALKILQEEK